MSNAFYPVAINMLTISHELDTVQTLTNMFFRGIVEGSVTVAIMASGTRLLFNNAESATFIELDDTIKTEYTDAVGMYIKKLHAASMDNSVWNTMSVPSHKYTTSPAGLSTSLSAYPSTNKISNTNPTLGTYP
jgi:hypothetical protein